MGFLLTRLIAVFIVSLAVVTCTSFFTKDEYLPYDENFTAPAYVKFEDVNITFDEDIDPETRERLKVFIGSLEELISNKNVSLVDTLFTKWVKCRTGKKWMSKEEVKDLILNHSPVRWFNLLTAKVRITQAWQTYYVTGTYTTNKKRTNLYTMEIDYQNSFVDILEIIYLWIRY